MGSHSYPVYEYRAVREAPGTRHRVAIVGAGPVGLAAAIDLAQRGIPAVVLDEDNTVSVGSRAICWAKRTLEIFDRLGMAGPLMARGVTWNHGKVFHGAKALYGFNLLPEPDHKFPAFINLQQYYVEEALVARCAELPGVDLRWQNRVAGLAQHPDRVVLSIETPDGLGELCADYVIAADGARSTLRRLLGLEFEGRVFEDRFLIADVKMKADFPAERWFWFAPPFHSGPSALLHRQADDIWRIDLQLGPEVDPEEEKKPERVIPRLKAMLGPDRPFELEWVSIYRFQCRMIEKFRHGRVYFAGDSAHQVSPFGARGGNSGVQDTDNLVWKLALVLEGRAPHSLLESYDAERVYAARENLRITAATTDFMSAKSIAAVAQRDAVLELAETMPFARSFVNSGRLSTPTELRQSPLNTQDRGQFGGGPAPGAPAPDAPILKDGREGWLLEELGDGFSLLVFGDVAAATTALAALPQGLPSVRLVALGAPTRDEAPLTDGKGIAFRRYDARTGTAYLLRPDQHVAARWRTVDGAALAEALGRAVGRATAPTGEDPGQPTERGTAASLCETLNVGAPDALYELLVAAHQGLSPEESLKLDAKLILILANHLGDPTLVRAALAKAGARGALSESDRA